MMESTKMNKTEMEEWICHLWLWVHYLVGASAMSFANQSIFFFIGKQSNLLKEHNKEAAKYSVSFA